MYINFLFGCNGKGIESCAAMHFKFLRIYSQPVAREKRVAALPFAFVALLLPWRRKLAKRKRTTCHTKIDQLLSDMSYIQHHSLATSWLAFYLFSILSFPNFRLHRSNARKIHKYIYDVLILQVSAHTKFYQRQHFYDFNARISVNFQIQGASSLFLKKLRRERQPQQRVTRFEFDAYQRRSKVSFNKLQFDFNRLSFKFISIFQQNLIGTSQKNTERKIVMRFTSLFVWKENINYILFFYFICINFIEIWILQKTFFSFRKCLIKAWKNEQHKKSFKCLIWSFLYPNSFIRAIIFEKPFKSFFSMALASGDLLSLFTGRKQICRSCNWTGVRVANAITRIVA